MKCMRILVCHAGAGTKDGLALVLNAWPDTRLHLKNGGRIPPNRLYPGKYVEVDFDGKPEEIENIRYIMVEELAATVVHTDPRPRGAELAL